MDRFFAGAVMSGTGVNGLRMVPIKCKGFCDPLGRHKKVYICKDYWNPQRKIKVAIHFLDITTYLALNLHKNSNISIFLKNRRKGYFFTDFLRIRLYLQESKLFVHLEIKDYDNDHSLYVCLCLSYHLHPHPHNRSFDRRV